MSQLSERMPVRDAVRQVPASPNFGLLVQHNPLLADYVSQAERCVFDAAYAVWQVPA